MLTAFLLAWLVISVLLLGYTLVGYPLLVILLASLRPASRRTSRISPSVTVIIPAFNEEAVLAEKLESVLALDYPPDRMQILVADDGSEDATAAIARSYQGRGVELYAYTARRGKVAAMNETALQARGDIVVFTDADVLCPPDSLQCLVNPFADERVGCVTAGHRIRQAGSSAGFANDLYWRFESLLKASESRLHTTVAASGHMLAVRRSLVEPIPPGIVIDDFYRALTVLRRGYRVVYEPAAVCWQRPTVSMADEITRRRRMTAGRYQVMAAMGEFLPHLSPMARFQVISHKFTRPFLPILAIIIAATNLALLLIPWASRPPRILWMGLMVMALAQGLFYILALAGFILDRLRIKSGPLSLPYYLVSANLGALQGLVTYLSGRQSVLWEQAKRT
jgi:cellulose synthase/poly-beta-1,6-N-acetylglucosamine synthase-like glycosyltransferase